MTQVMARCKTDEVRQRLYTRLVNVYVRARRPKRALAVIQHMHRAGLTPEPALSGVVMRSSLRRLGVRKTGPYAGQRRRLSPQRRLEKMVVDLRRLTEATGVRVEAVGRRVAAREAMGVQTRWRSSTGVWRAVRRSMMAEWADTTVDLAKRQENVRKLLAMARTSFETLGDANSVRQIEKTAAKL